MKTIRTMILGIFFIFAIFISAMLIIVSYVGINALSDRDSDQIIELTAKERKNDIDNMMDDIRRSLDSVYYYAHDGLEKNTDRVEDASFREDYIKGVEEIALLEAASAEGSMAVYFRFTNDLKEEPYGFLYKKNSEGSFQKLKLTDISAYDKNDFSHVGWYYIPKKSKNPVWIGPYRNENLDEEIISYIAPIYIEGKFYGIVGMDINVDTFREKAAAIRIYETGSACLFDLEDNLVYHKDYPQGVEREFFDSEIMVLLQAKQESISRERPAELASAVRPMKVYAIRLENGMTLCLNVPVDELFSDRTNILGYAILFSVIVMLLAFICAYWVIKSSLKPLKELTEAADQISAGNLDVKLEYTEDDEFGLLSRSFNNMAAMMKSYFYHFHSLAYTDELTGLNNKAAFLITKDVIESEINMGRAAFSVIVININDMTEINETRGNDTGDEVIRHVVLCMREAFVGFPIYRTQGDEFCVIVNDTDPGKLSEAFLKVVDRRSLEDEKKMKIRYSVAAGEADYESEHDKRFDDVFERAGQMMMRNKNKMKAARG